MPSFIQEMEKFVLVSNSFVLTTCIFLGRCSQCELTSNCGLSEHSSWKQDSRFRSDTNRYCGNGAETLSLSEAGRTEAPSGVRNQKLTLNPSVVRMDKALGTSKAMFCFFTM